MSNCHDFQMEQEVLCAKSLRFCLKSHTLVREISIGAFLTSFYLQLLAQYPSYCFHSK